MAGEAEANDHDWGAEGAAVAADARPTNDAKEADEVQVLDKESSEQLDFAKENLRRVVQLLAKRTGRCTA